MKGRSWVPFVAGIALGVAVGAAVYFAFIHRSGDGGSTTKPYTVPSEAMAPTYEPGDEIEVNVDAYSGEKPQVGDVVVFHPPAGADKGTECGITTGSRMPIEVGEPCPKPTAGASSQVFLKRIVAGPGDTLSIKGGHPVVNGAEQSDEPFVLACGGSSACNLPKTITIPPGEYFMLGDNRGASDDSRFWGPVPAEWIVGRVE